MNLFDNWIMEFINQFAHQWFLFDKIVKAVAVNNLFKGFIFALILWWAWFRNEADDSHRRQHILATLIGSFAAIGVARFLAAVLPHRLRPIHDTTLNFIIPYGVSVETLDGWSSFPSDHATLFFALSASLLFINRKLGILALLYTTLVICFPRVYTGFHWPTDIIVGTIIGVAIAFLCNIVLFKNKHLYTGLQALTNVSSSHPMLFYPVLFLVTYQIAELFESSRAIASAVVKLFLTIF